MKINVCYYVTDCKVLRKAEVTLKFLKISAWNKRFQTSMFSLRDILIYIYAYLSNLDEHLYIHMCVFINGCTWTRSQIYLHTVPIIHQRTLLGAAAIAIQLQDKYISMMIATVMLSVRSFEQILHLISPFSVWFFPVIFFNTLHQSTILWLHLFSFLLVLYLPTTIFVV